MDRLYSSLKLDSFYSSLTKRVDYRILAWLTPIFSILMLLFVLVNGLDYGIDFKGGMWIESYTSNKIDATQLKSLADELTALGLKDVKTDVGYDINTGQNKIIAQTTTVFKNDSDVRRVITKYTGSLVEYDTAQAKIATKPPVELKDNLLKRLKYGVDVNYQDGTLTIRGLDLNKEDLDSALTYYLNEKVDVTLTKKNYDIKSVGPTLGTTFREQGFKALILSFILMSIVVFLAFKEPIPCIAVIQAAICDIAISVGGMSLLHIPLESASIGALLMLIGYSVDTDIMLTSRTLKDRSREFNDQVDDAVKTGLTMNGTTLVALSVVYVVSVMFTQIPMWTNISSVLIIGLFADLPATWLTNAGIIKWYLEGGGRHIKMPWRRFR